MPKDPQAPEGSVTLIITQKTTQRNIKRLQKAKSHGFNSRLSHHLDNNRSNAVFSFSPHRYAVF